MATVFLSQTKIFLPCPPSISTSSTPCTSSSSLFANFSPICAQKHNDLSLCKAKEDDGAMPSSTPVVAVTKRSLGTGFTATILLSLAEKGSLLDANAAILEADDDEELLEKVKKDRKRRIERQGVINSSTKEKAYLQDVVYKLSKVGQAIEKEDLSAASFVLGQGTNTDWVQKVNEAFNKLTSTPEEKSEVDYFNSSLSSLITSVTKNDIEASKVAFVASASALEKWSVLTGLVEQLKGL